MKERNNMYVFTGMCFVFTVKTYNNQKQKM